MKKILFLTVLSAMLLSGGILFAGEPTFQYSGDECYGSYTGKVAYAYVNKHNWFLLYFDTSISASTLTYAQTHFDSNITNRGAAIFLMNENPEFAKYLYATMLTAKATGKTVTIQMRGVYGGYAKIDRIWLGD
jgi:hypothetical protein